MENLKRERERESRSAVVSLSRAYERLRRRGRAVLGSNTDTHAIFHAIRGTKDLSLHL